jgi:two-component system, OmpR family, phosphate regulon sensor histidine kinase PhoR
MGALLRAIRRRIALKLTLTLVGFVGVSMLVAGFYLDRALESFAVLSLEARLAAVGGVLEDEARAVLREGAAPALAQAFVVRAAQPTRARLTLIAADGRVLGESERPAEALARLENHRDRPEVRAALGGRVGRDLRRSATLDAPLLYVALPVHDAGQVIGVLRLALPLAAVTASYATLHQVMLAGGALTVAVAFGIGIFVAGRVTRPVVEMQSIARQMSEGNFLVRAPSRSTDEIGTLGRSLNVMAARLREKIEDLQQEQAKVTAILDAMVEGVIAVDGHEHVVLMNERVRAIFGLGAVRGERKPFLEVIRNADLHEVFRASRTAPPGTVVHREIRLTAPAPRVLQVNAVPLSLAAGETGVVIVLHDVSELRRLEQVRTEFVANVSHELRTPLTAIHGYVETLLGGALEEPDNARRFLEIVHRQTERLGRLIDDLTELSNIELGKVSLDLAPTRLDEVIESVLAVVLPRARAGGVTVSVETPAGLPPVEADHDRLAQILINLVDNAVKYTPRGGAVTIRAAATGPAVMEVAVEDTGVGIPAADLPRVTERFYRVDKARSRELGGTGLGLAIVKHLVLAHGGEIRIDSAVGRGTTVRFTLPICRSEEAVDADPGH